MNTISVTVEQASQAFMLVEWLKNIRFVKDVTIDMNRTARGNVEAVQNALDAIRSQKPFSDITDPVEYQRSIRDEWR
jgi:succinate dehydrogenase/fumarate reductase-like Fe-S protein